MNPKKRSGRLPCLKGVTSTEPLGSPLGLTIGCNVVIYGWIRRRLPFHKALKQLPPCERVRGLSICKDKLMTNALRRRGRTQLFA